MARLKIVIVDHGYASYEPEMEEFAALDAEVVRAECKAESEIGAACADADAVLIRRLTLGPATMDKLTRCRVISKYGVGVDNVDVAAATKRGIPVLNVQDYCMDEVATHALALLLACVRRIASTDRQVRAGKWDVGWREPIYRVAGKVLGLVAYGRIARALHRKVAGLGLAEVLAYDPFVAPDEIARLGARPVGLDEVLTRSDYISVHPPLKADTWHMIGRREFAQMKPTAILVNTARGPVVDPDALYEALSTGRIMAAGIDVHEPEPLPLDSPFRTLPNIVLTDHAAWYSEESERELQRKVARNAVLVLTGRPPLFCVNTETLPRRSP